MKLGPRRLDEEPDSRSANVYRREMDEALEARPPVITWRKNSRGILVATTIDDPHTQVVSPRPINARPRRKQKQASPRQPRREPAALPHACGRGHEFDAWNTIVGTNGSFECRICTRPRETPLLAAARTAI